MKLRLLLFVVLLPGCFGGGTTVKDSGPSRPIDMSHIPDAVPRLETRTRAGNKSPYTVLGKTYYVLPDDKGYSEVGGASWYGKKFHGRKTSNGETYDMYGMTAAHKTLPIPSYVRVTNLANGRDVVVRVNDRGPFHGGRIIDLTYAAASKLGFVQQGTAEVRVDVVTPNAEMSNGTGKAVQVKAKTEELPTPEKSYRLPFNTYLQAGAFSSLQGAETVQKRIVSLTAVPVKIVDSPTDNLYRVRLGPILDNQVLIGLRKILAENSLPKPNVIYE